MEAKVSTMSSSAPRGRSPTSYSEYETAELRQKILEMTALCKQLQDHVEFLENKMTFPGDEMSGSQAAKGNESYETSSNSSSEHTILKEKLKELVAMNINWQKHNTQQEKKLQEQSERIARLERELATRSSGQLPESQQIEFDEILLAKKHMYNSLEEEKTRIEEENHQLKQKVARLQTQQEGLAKTLSEVQERCQLLEAQLVMYQEDFKTERSDRERAQSRNADLEILVADLQKQQMPYQESGSRQARSNLHNGFSSWISQPAAYQPREELRGRGVDLGLYQTDCDAGSGSSTRERSTAQYASAFQTDGVDETDCYQVVVAQDMPNYRHVVDDDELSCPKCHRGFLRDRHLDLLEHMEECN